MKAIGMALRWIPMLIFALLGLIVIWSITSKVFGFSMGLLWGSLPDELQAKITNTGMGAGIGAGAGCVVLTAGAAIVTGGIGLAGAAGTCWLGAKIGFMIGTALGAVFG